MTDGRLWGSAKAARTEELYLPEPGLDLKEASMTDKEIWDALSVLAKRLGISLSEADYIVRMAAQADYDPLPPSEWGEPFEFSRRKWCPLDNDDFININPNVPRPNAQVDLLTAWRECGDDLRNISDAYKSGHHELTIEQSWQLFVINWAWVLFWSVRHHDASSRARFVELLRQIEASAARICRKLRRHDPRT